ncbi:MAG: OmpA family protein [Leptospiraceae bacterium]|nr:OmpA family protein [Leptospiraceae bacterium]
MKQLLLIFILFMQIQLYPEEITTYSVFTYGKDFQLRIESIKSQLDSLIEIRSLELESMKSQIKKLELKIQEDSKQYDKDRKDFQEKLKAYKEQEQEIITLKKNLLELELKYIRTDKDRELFKTTNEKLQIELEYLRNREKKLKDLVQKLSAFAKAQKKKKDTILTQYKDLKTSISSVVHPNEGTAFIDKYGDYTRLVIRLSGTISFASGSTTIRNQVKPILNSIFKIITKYPGYHIFIEGHTDNVPFHTATIKNNWELSTKRALGVLEYAVIANPALDLKRISASGYGEYHPIATNFSKEGRRKNRRVDIIVIYWESKK